MALPPVSKNDPRFCAQYLGYLGEAVVPRSVGLAQAQLKVGALALAFVGGRDFSVRDEVYLAKRVPTPRGEPQRWRVHCIRLAQAYWHYEQLEHLTPKEQRKTTPYPQTWFGTDSRIVTPV